MSDKKQDVRQLLEDLEEPATRQLSDGRVKDNVTGFVEEPYWQHADEVNKR